MRLGCSTQCVRGAFASAYGVYRTTRVRIGKHSAPRKGKKNARGWEEWKVETKQAHPHSRITLQLSNSPKLRVKGNSEPRELPGSREEKRHHMMSKVMERWGYLSEWLTQANPGSRVGTRTRIPPIQKIRALLFLTEAPSIMHQPANHRGSVSGAIRSFALASGINYISTLARLPLSGYGRGADVPRDLQRWRMSPLSREIEVAESSKGFGENIP